MAYLYPSYEVNGSNKNISAYPLLRMKFANLVKNATVQENAVSVLKGGLTGWLDGVEFTPNLEAGFHHMSPKMNPKDQKTYNGNSSTNKNKSHTFVPKVYDLSFSFNVVHEHSLGWNGTSWLGGNDKGFPYGYEVQGGKAHDVNRGSATVNNSPMNRIQQSSENTQGTSVRKKGRTRTDTKKAQVDKATKKALGKK